MMCDPCKVAGINNYMANLAISFVARESHRATARNYHSICLSPSCTCQHKVGQALKGASDGNR